MRAAQHDFAIGQEVYFVPADRRHRDPSWLKITKVGRKWVSIDSRDRFDRDTLIVDGAGYSSPGRVYIDREEYELGQRRQAGWDLIQTWMRGRYRVPGDMTLETLHQVHTLLGIKPPALEGASPSPSHAARETGRG